VRAGSALITMVLHHADHPAEILRNAVRFVPPGAPVVISEFQLMTHSGHRPCSFAVMHKAFL
jgi:2-polyprenyl-3-methyl-5-hydroxy-6-metoxy-1,4-benzoquinol methylase